MLMIFAYLPIISAIDFFKDERTIFSPPESERSHPIEFGADLDFSRSLNSFFISAPNAKNDADINVGKVYKCQINNRVATCVDYFKPTTSYTSSNVRNNICPRFGASIKYLERQDLIYICAPNNKAAIENGKFCFLYDAKTSGIVQSNTNYLDSSAQTSDVYGTILKSYAEFNEDNSVLIGQISFTNNSKTQGQLSNLVLISNAPLRNILLSENYIGGVLVNKISDERTDIIIFYSKSNNGYGSVEVKAKDFETKQRFDMDVGTFNQGLGFSSAKLNLINNESYIAAAAPFYSGEFNEGRVYFFKYVEESKLERLNFTLSEEGEMNLKFGISIASLGDLNGDFNDEFAVLVHQSNDKISIIFVYEFENELSEYIIAQKLFISQDKTESFLALKLSYGSNINNDQNLDLTLNVPSQNTVLAIPGTNTIKIIINFKFDSVPVYIGKLKSTFDDLEGFYYFYALNISLSVGNLPESQYIVVKLSVFPENPMGGYFINGSSVGENKKEWSINLGKDVIERNSLIYQLVNPRTSDSMKIFIKGEMTSSGTRTSSQYNVDPSIEIRNFTIVSKFSSCIPSICQATYSFSASIIDLPSTKYGSKIFQIKYTITPSQMEFPSAIYFTQNVPEYSEVELFSTNAADNFTISKNIPESLKIEFLTYLLLDSKENFFEVTYTVELDPENITKSLSIPLEFSNPLYKNSFVHKQIANFKIDLPLMIELKIKNQPESLVLPHSVNEMNPWDTFLNYTVDFQNVFNQFDATDLKMTISINQGSDDLNQLKLYNTDPPEGMTVKNCLNKISEECNGGQLLYELNRLEAGDNKRLTVKLNISRISTNELQKMNEFSFLLSASWTSSRGFQWTERNINTKIIIITEIDFTDTSVIGAIVGAVIGAILIVIIITVVLVKTKVFKKTKNSMIQPINTKTY